MGEVTTPTVEAPVPLIPSHDTARFNCGYEALDHWLRRRALAAEGLSARSYVSLGEGRVVGYYALSSGEERRQNAPGRMRRTMPERIPLVVMGRLAIDRTFQKTGLGRALVKDAFLKVLQASTIVGVRALVVHAIDDSAIPFYKKFGFEPSPLGDRTLFLAIEKIVRAVSGT